MQAFDYPKNVLPPYWPPGLTIDGELPEQVDAVVIGGGMTGISAAFHLQCLQPQWRVLLLEARTLAGGASGRNGGLLWPAYVYLTAFPELNLTLDTIVD